MPQMAPILWFPLFLFMVSLVSVIVCATFFDKKVTQTITLAKSGADKKIWLW